VFPQVLEFDSAAFFYQFLVYNGPKTSSVGNDAWNVQVCAVVGCSGSALETCTDPTALSNYTLSTRFETLQIKGSDFESTFNAIPTTLMNDYRTSEDFVYTKPLFGAPGEISIASTVNAGGISGIHTFGIYMALD
jgi:Vanin C-terminal domain